MMGDVTPESCAQDVRIGKQAERIRDLEGVLEAVGPWVDRLERDGKLGHPVDCAALATYRAVIPWGCGCKGDGCPACIDTPGYAALAPPEPATPEAVEGTACNLVCHVCKGGIGKGETIMWHGSGLGAAHVTCEMRMSKDPTATPEAVGDEEILNWLAKRWWLDTGTQNAKWRKFDPSDSSETNDLRGDIITAMRADDA